MTKKNIFYLFFVLSMFLIDRLSKFWVIKNFDLNENLEIVIFPFLSIHLIWNEGIAFGLLSFGENNLYNFLTLIIAFLIIIIFWLMIKANGIEKYGFMMILGGSIGNILDRLIYSAVPDFIDIHYKSFHWFIFNLADIFITIGVFLLILTEMFLKNKKQK